MNKSLDINLVQQLLGSDHNIFKVFPVLLKYAKGIEYSDSLIDYFIDNYLFDKERFLDYIPHSSFKKEHYRRMCLLALQDNEATIYQVPNIFNCCKEYFDLALLIYKSTGSYLFSDDLDESQVNKISSTVLKLLNKKDGSKIYASSYVIANLCDKINDIFDRKDKKIISKLQAENFIKLVTSNTTNIDEDKVYKVYMNILNTYDDLYDDIFINHMYTLNKNFILGVLLKNKGKDEVVKKVVELFSIKYHTFKNMKKVNHYDCDGIFILREILDQEWQISYDFGGKIQNIYKYGYIKNFIFNIVQILRDQNNFQSYIMSVAKTYNI